MTDNPLTPSPVQADFLATEGREALLVGTSLASGLTTALILCALQFVERPDSHAALFVKNIVSLTRPHGLIEMVKSILAGTDAQANSRYTQWLFPNGASLLLAHLSTEEEWRKHSAADFGFIGVDNLNEFTPKDYDFLLTRNRETGNPSPQLRATFRMGSITEENRESIGWIRDRFKDKPVVQAGLRQNPYINQEVYDAQLQALDAVSRAQIVGESWDSERNAT